MIRDYFEFIKIGHTVFALPFCLIAYLQAARVAGFRWSTLIWLAVTFTAARAFAMAMNRILDRSYDAKNPRTAGRHMATGAITLPAAIRFAVACAAAFVFGAAQFNALCGALALPVLAYLAFYSYTKRFTRWSHLVLGGALGLAPIAAELAVLASVSSPTLALAAAVVFWVAGFDVVYAIQDIEFDRNAGLHSIPARLGADGARAAAVGLHATAFLLFQAYGLMLDMGAVYFGAQAVILLLLAYEHTLAWQNKIEDAFFKMNGMVSVAMLAAVVLDLWRRGAAG